MSSKTSVRSPTLLLLALLLLAAPAFAEVCKGSRVPRAELAHYDGEATLAPQEIETALNTHLPYGQPACPKLLPGREYVLCYTLDQRTSLCASASTRRMPRIATGPTKHCRERAAPDSPAPAISQRGATKRRPRAFGAEDPPLSPALESMTLLKRQQRRSSIPFAWTPATPSPPRGQVRPA